MRKAIQKKNILWLLNNFKQAFLKKKKRHARRFASDRCCNRITNKAKQTERKHIKNERSSEEEITHSIEPIDMQKCCEMKEALKL